MSSKQDIVCTVGENIVQCLQILETFQLTIKKDTKHTSSNIEKLISSLRQIHWSDHGFSKFDMEKLDAMRKDIALLESILRNIAQDLIECRQRIVEDVKGVAEHLKLEKLSLQQGLCEIS